MSEISRPPDAVAAVRPLMGTAAGVRWLYASSACRPFGMVQPSPDTVPDRDWGGGYDHSVRRVECLSHLHGWQIGGLAVMPMGRTPASVDGYGSAFDPDRQVVHPGYHAFRLDDHGVDVELTASERVAFHRYRFDDAAAPGVLMDLARPLGPCAFDDAEIERRGDRLLVGSVTMLPTRRRPKPLTLFFAARFDRPPTEMTRVGDGVWWVGLDTVGNVAEWRVALSYTGVDGALRNLDAEGGEDVTFDAALAETFAAWDKLLTRIEIVDPGTGDPHRFATDHWRTLLGRRQVGDVDGAYIDNTSPEPVVRKGDGPTYNSDAFWGAQWGLVPFWALVHPERVVGFCESFLRMGRDGGLIPRGPAGGNYTFVMTSAQTTPLFAAAVHALGWRPDDVDELLRLLKRNHGPDGLMAKAGYEHDTCLGGRVAQYEQLGYIVDDIPPETAFHTASVSQTLEHAFNDWALAELLDTFGDADAARYRKRSGNWRNAIDPAVGFARPRLGDGSWREPFDPMDKLGFAEGNAWQYTWYVPHDPAGLARHLGGVERTLDQLERCFELAEPTGFIAPHGQHHASTLDFGNQPSTHIAHLFHHLGRPDRTDHWLDRVFAAAKSGTTVHDGYGGDEDQGLMAAWNVLVQLGLFNTTGLAARNPTWQRTRPHFRQVRIHRPNADEPIHLDADTTTREITHNTLVDERA